MVVVDVGRSDEPVEPPPVAEPEVTPEIEPEIEPPAVEIDERNADLLEVAAVAEPPTLASGQDPTDETRWEAEDGSDDSEPFEEPEVDPALLLTKFRRVAGGPDAPGPPAGRAVAVSGYEAQVTYPGRNRAVRSL